MADDGWDDEDEDPFGAMGDATDLVQNEAVYEHDEPPEILDATAKLCTDSELEICLQVLEALQEEKQVFLQSRRFKKVRKVARELTKVLDEKMYDGMSLEEYQKMHLNARIQNSIKDRMKAKDKQKLDMARLRSARMARLAALQSDQSDGGYAALSMVPDGAVDPDIDGVEAQTLLAGVGAQNSFAVKEGRRTIAKSDSISVSGAAGRGLPAIDGGGLVEDAGEEPEAEAGSGAQGDDEDGTTLYRERSCYLCKNWFSQLHHFYDQFCPSCAAVNWEKRHQTSDLRGRIALLTGGRVKIGYHVGLKLLRCGANCIITSRFPADTARRYAAEADFAEWADRLHCYGLDLREVQAVERFCAHVLEKYGRLDILVNNACQTVRRPVAYYQHLLQGESSASGEEEAERLRPLLANHSAWRAVDSSRSDFTPLLHQKGSAKPTDDGSTTTAATTTNVTDGNGGVLLSEGAAGGGASTGHDSVGMSQMRVHKDDEAVSVGARAPTADGATALAVPGHEGDVVLPEGVYDVNGQQLDTRRENSWLLKLGEVQTVEAAEVLAINALAPFTLNSLLKPAFLAAVEATGKAAAAAAAASADASDDSGSQRDDDVTKGQAFVINVSAMEGKFYRFKTPNHPHTNMAKAALNMMTRTSAGDYSKQRIFMNAVDTGWINDENPLEKAARIAGDGFQTPIDEVDAAARILDPVMTGVNGEALHYGVFFKDYRLTEW